VQNAGLWSALLSIIACAACPVCLTTYAKLFSVLGMGIGLSERLHGVVLFIAIALSIGVSTWRSMRTRRIWPLVAAVIGSALVVLGHSAGALHSVEWVGIVVLFLSGMAEHFRLRRRSVARARVVA